MISLDTFRTDDLDPTLLTLSWNNVRDEADLWQTLFQLLHLLYESQPQLGTIRFGELIVEMSQVGAEGDDLRVEHWPIKGPYAVERLERRVKEVLANGMIYLLPIKAYINIEAYLFLPSNVKEVRVLWYDTPDLLDLGPLSIKLAPCQAPDDFVRWQAINHSEYAEAGSDVYLEIGCEWSPWAQQIVLDVCSRLDLWRAYRFDGSPNEPLGSVNFRHLRELMRHIARVLYQKSADLPSVKPLAFAVA